MIRRSPWRRALAALLGAWFTLARVEPVPLHPCAMHDGAAGARVLATVQATVLGLSTDAALHGAHPSEAGSHETVSGDAHGSHDAHAVHAAGAMPAASPASATPHATTPAPDDDAPAGHAHEGCLCLGCCSGVTAVAAAPEAPMAWLAQLLEIAPRLDAPGAQLAPAPRDDVALPFPVGPPALA
jgi:hypothetical protein